MKLAIKGSSITLVKDASLVENSEVSYPVEFVFDESWDGFTKTALFKTDGDSISVPLADDKCTIPAECLKKAGVWLQISVQGTNGGEDISTKWCETSRIMYRVTIDMVTGGNGNGSGSGGNNCGCGGSGLPDEAYNKIMDVIGDLAEAGFEGKTLVEIIVDTQKSICDTATDEEVEDALKEAFGNSNPGLPGEESSSNTATDEEVEDVLDSVFGTDSSNPGLPGEESPGNTATDDEVEDVLDAVFGKQP